MPYLLALPAAALLLVFLYGVLNGVLQGFGIMPFLDMYTPTLKYYEAALTRPDLVQSIQYSLYISGISAVFATILGVALSAVLTWARTSRFTRLFNIQMPILTTHSLVALAVLCLFAGSGMIPRILALFGLVSEPTDFVSVLGATSGWGIILVYLWKEAPFIAFCTVTIMANITDSLGEAAECLGAGTWKTFFNITLPLCKGAILKAFLIVFAFAFGAYEVPFLLGPSNPKAMPILAYIQFQNPDILDRCYAMALNGIMVLLCTVMAIIYYVTLQREDKNGKGSKAEKAGKRGKKDASQEKGDKR